MYCEVGLIAHLTDEGDEPIQLPVIVAANPITGSNEKAVFSELEVLCLWNMYAP